MSLPLPFVDFSGQSRVPSIVSDAQSSVIAGRSRFEKRYATLNVQWVFTQAELEIFEDFFDDDLGNGCACFSLELRYPLNSELTEWLVRFTEGYDVTNQEGMFSVQASLELVNPVVLPALADELP